MTNITVIDLGRKISRDDTALVAKWHELELEYGPFFHLSAIGGPIRGTDLLRMYYTHQELPVMATYLVEKHLAQ